MNKRQLFRTGSRMALGIAFATIVCFVPACATAADKPASAVKKMGEGTGQLVVARAANLGQAVVGLSVDGKEVAKLNFGGSYTGPIAAGEHTVTTIPIPNREHAQPSPIRVNVEPGKTYKFTAFRSDVAIVLR